MDDHAVLDIPQAVGWFGLIVPVLGVADHTHPRPKDIGDSTENVVCSVPELVVGQNKGIAPDWVYSTFRWLRYNHSGYCRAILTDDEEEDVLPPQAGFVKEHWELCAHPFVPLQYRNLVVPQVVFQLSLVGVQIRHVHDVVPHDPVVGEEILEFDVSVASHNIVSVPQLHDQSQ